MAPCKKEQENTGCETKYDAKGEVKGCFIEGTENKCPPSGVTSGGGPKISNRYRINYLNSKNNYQKGGDSHASDHQEETIFFKSTDKLKWTNEQSKVKYDFLLGKIGPPNKICKNSNGMVEYVVWQDPYDNVTLGHYGGLDYLKLSNYHAKKFHPYPAPVFIIAGKYMRVPDKLLGPIKYASETINIEQLFVEQESNVRYGEDGTKELALVTGSCASINISTITVGFVEDMIPQYEDSNKSKDELDKIFRNEYDARIAKYIDKKTKGKYDEIKWYDPEYFGEPEST